jgi:ammonium transporter, Amt family
VDHFPTRGARSPGVTVPGYSASVTAILALIVKHTIGLRLDDKDDKEEMAGIGAAEHAETGYDFVVTGAALIQGRHGAKE